MKNLALVVFTAFLLAGASLGLRAVAGDKEDAAEALNREGRARYDKRDNVGAVEKFRAAWELVPEARYAYNLGRVLADMGRNAEAAEFLAIYLAHAQADPKLVGWVQRELTKLEAKIARVRVQTDQPGARLRVNGAPHTQGGADFTVRLDPGTYLVEVDAGAGGPVVQETLRVGAGERRELDWRARLVAPPAAPDAGPRDADPPDATPVATAPPDASPFAAGPGVRVVVTPWWRDPLGLGLAVAGVVVLGVSGGSYVKSGGELDDADAAAFAPDHDAALADARASRRVAQWSAGAGAVLLVGATLRFVMHGDTRREAPVRVGVGADGGALIFGWGGRW